MNQDERTKALRVSGMVSALRWKGGCSEEDIAIKAGFESVEHMRWQLARWGLPDWIRFNSQVDISETAHQGEAPKQKGRSSGPPEKVPSAAAAIPLFKEAIDVLLRAVEGLEHLDLVSQGGRLLGTHVEVAPVYFTRESFPDKEWRELCELHDHDPDSSGFLAHGLTSKFPVGASRTPPYPLPALIAAYVLADRPLEPLLDALHRDPPLADREAIKKLAYARKTKGGDSRDGLIRTAEQLAEVVSGSSKRGPGNPPTDVPPREQAIAYRITELVESGTSDEAIQQELLPHGITRSEYHRLKGLRLRYPKT